MINGWLPETTVPSHAECRQVRERAQRILAEAQMLCDRLDQTGGLLSFALETRDVVTEVIPLAVAAQAQRQPALFAA